jgi:hypothetical protein
MGDEIKAITPQEALFREAEALERLVELYRKIRGAGASEGIDAERPITEVPLARLGIEDAVTYVLRSVRDPQKTSQIYSTLLAADYPFISENPMHAIQGAVKRLSMKANPDVAYVGGGKWTLTSNYSPTKLQKLKERLSGRGGRSRDEHGQRTKEGMIAKGARFGRHPKFRQDHIAKFRQLVEVEKMRPLKALQEVGISTAYYYQYKEQIYAWKQGDPWPPTQKEPTPPDSGADVIPLHGRAGSST